LNCSHCLFDRPLEEKKTFRIWCEVWGGVTDRRASWLKSNGGVAQYITREEAEAEAARLNRKMGGNSYSTTSFRYSVKP
jgi:hypothetical protein